MASWAVHWDLALGREDGGAWEPIEWFHAPMIEAVAPWMTEAMERGWHRAEAKEEAARWSFELDVEALVERLEREGIMGAQEGAGAELR